MKGSSIIILIALLIIFLANEYFVAFMLNPFGVPGSTPAVDHGFHPLLLSLNPFGIPTRWDWIFNLQLQVRLEISYSRELQAKSKSRLIKNSLILKRLVPDRH